MEKINLKDQIDDYLRYSQVERGLSDNTINAYRQDLEEFRTLFHDSSFAALDGKDTSLIRTLTKM